MELYQIFPILISFVISHCMIIYEHKTKLNSKELKCSFEIWDPKHKNIVHLGLVLFAVFRPFLVFNF